MLTRLPLCLAVLLCACAQATDLDDLESPDAGDRDDRASERDREKADEPEKDDEDEQADEDADEPTLATYYGHVRPILETHCLACHVEGGIGPMRLDDLESVSEVRALVVAAVEVGLMPPWPASDECYELRDVRALSGDELDLLKAWREAGYPDGDEDDYEAPEKTQVGVPESEPSVILSPADSYVPNTALTDEYRCFLTEGTFEEDTYLTGMDIRPGTRDQVHHVQVHKITVDQIPAVNALDAATQGAGYACGGGAGQGIRSVNMFSWRPGSAAILFEEGDAALVEAGSAFVLQVHYNTQYLPETGPVPDRSGVAFWTLPSGRYPDRIVTRRGVLGPVAPGDGVIPAGESNVVGEATVAMSTLSTVNGRYVQGEIIGMTPHMHALGTRLSATLHQGGTDACMIDVPDWDFEWQLDYSYMKPASYGPNDELTVRCEYDNSAANQPLLDGRPITPRDVGWGEGSLDEMCLNYVWFRFERAAFFDAYQQ